MKHIVDTAYKIVSAKQKRGEYIRIMVNKKKLKRFQKGFYGLVDSEIQKVENSSR